ncbi:MAG: hypothetical protein KAH56_06090 [Candidatus Krumholzibacteria bacterium]|nr:hypothetical protein [Candidatus Krumholzibacteria bacterium]
MSSVKDVKSGAAERRWHIGISGGVQGGSDLFRVETIDGFPVPWDPDTGGGFQSSRFTAALDRNFSFGLYMTRDLGSVWSVRADLGYSRMDVAAEALTGQTGAVFLFDRMDVLNLGLGVEVRLVRAPSYPFLNASMLVSHLGPVRAEDLEQTNMGGRLGLGYFHSSHEVWGLRAEARMSWTGFSIGNYVPQSELSDQPALDYDTEDHLIFFEFLIGIQANIL